MTTKYTIYYLRSKGKLVTAVLATALFALALAAGCFGWRSKATSMAATNLSPLRGEAAVESLKKDGSFDSLAKAVAAAQYQITGQRDRFVAENTAQQFSANFSAKELRISRTQSGQVATQFGLRLLGYDYGQGQFETGEEKISSSGDRIEIQKQGVTEWYINKPEGLEQGFTIHERSAAGNSLKLDLQLTGGLSAEAAEDNQSILLKDDNGHVVFSYSQLAAWDANGKGLPTQMKVSGDVITLEVEDAQAQYPLTIDPLISAPQKLLASDGAASDAFGTAVAINEDGSLALIGAYGDANQKGSVYAFRRANGIWTQEAKLTNSSGVADDNFGWSVGISFSTAVIGAPGTATDRGTAYVFTRDNAGVWTQTGTLVGADSAAGDRFGWSVGVNAPSATNATIIAGALQHDDAAGAGQGSAYVFVRNNGLWIQQQKLLASDAAAGDEFGRAVSISGDYVAVTAPYDDISSVSDKGSAYVFVRNGAIWTQQAKLSANDGVTNDRLGSSVSISGNTVLVGAINDDIGNGNDQGSAYVFTRSGANWSQQAKLTAIDGAANDYFGISVDVKGDLAVVGSYFDDVNNIGDKGSAYVFARQNGTWTQQQKLSAADGIAGDQFGNSVAISGNSVLSGAWQSGSTNRGAAYVFTICDYFGQQQKLITLNPSQDMYFGYSVALEGNTAVVGASRWNNQRGAAFVFTRTAADTWIQTQMLTASNGDDHDSFGTSVAISGDTIVIGAELDNFAGQQLRGSVYVFLRNGGTWTQEINFSPSDGKAGEWFGSSVEISNGTVLVGARYGDFMLNQNQGSAYVFVRNLVGTWIQQAKLFNVAGAADDTFGWSISFDGDTALIGAPGESSEKGAAFVYIRNGSTWTLQQKLTAADGATGDLFGCSVALSGNTALIGARNDDNAHTDQGSAYLFDRSGATWTQYQKLTDSNGQAKDRFGSEVAIDGDWAAVGVPTDFDPGSVNVYRREGPTWALVKKAVASDGVAEDHLSFSLAIQGSSVLAGAAGKDVSGIPNLGAVYYFTCQECPAMTLSTLSNGTVGTAYNQTITVNGAAGPFQFSLAEGTLPPGLALSSGGIVSGTPTKGGTFNFSIQVMTSDLCTGIRHYTVAVINNNCPAITVNPATLPNGIVNSGYNQTITASGGTAPYSFNYTGALPPGVTLNQQTGQLSGQSNTMGGYVFSITATDANGCTGNRSYVVSITNGGGVSATDLQFYPLAHPVRLLDTRAGQAGCDAPGAKITGGTSRTQTAAGRTCDGLTIPANAAALVGNATSVQSGGGYFTLYPSDIAKPNSANSNFAANQILNSLFTVRLGANDGAFKIFASSDTDIVVDITGYYAPPSATGLYFHPLPKPVRLLDTRPGASACFTPGMALQGNTVRTQLGTTTCDSVLIPAGAQALTGNATTVSPQANGFLTLYPADTARPLIASANFQPGVNLNSPFMVGLSPSGEFNIYVASTTDLVIDVTGYYSTQLNDSNGQGLLFNALAGPTRLLDTRAGQVACYTPNAQMTGGTPYTQAATGACSNIPAAAQAVVGNATTLNAAANGYLTFWPSDASQPFIATSNYRTGITFNRHFTVGLGNDGAFKRYAASTTDLVVDLVGYFAP